MEYEFHLTVANEEVEKAQEWVKETGGSWKLITVVGNNLNDVMLSSRKSLENYSNYLADEMRKMPFEVKRIKVEIPIDSDITPNVAPIGNYFETHLEYNANNIRYTQIENFIEFWWNMAHLSKNKFKINPDGTWQQMVTIRAGSAFELGEQVNNFKYQLRDEYGLWPQKIQSEFVLFDSNSNHDDIWTNKGNENKEFL